MLMEQKEQGNAVCGLAFRRLSSRDAYDAVAIEMPAGRNYANSLINSISTHEPKQICATPKAFRSCALRVTFGAYSCYE